jgi:integrase
MGHIYKPKYKDKDGNTRESAVYWIKYYRNGKPLRESVKSKKEADAKRLLKRREGEISSGKLPGIYFDRVRYEELRDEFLLYRRQEKGEKSEKEAMRRTKHLDPFFEGTKIPRITTPKVRRYIKTRLEKNAANGTINRELSALKKMLNLGAQQSPPKVDRVPYIPMLKEADPRQGFFEQDAYERLMVKLPDYLKPVAVFGYMFGWRHSEILRLTWNKVDLKNGIIRLNPGETKNSEGRVVYLDEGLKKMFQALFVNRRLGVPFVFTRDGEPIKDFRKAWKKACKEANLNGMLFHDFRRTAVRDLVRAGVPERVAMQISGHKTRSIFERYNITSDRDLKEAIERKMLYHQEQKEISGQSFGQSQSNHEKRG